MTEEVTESEGVVDPARRAVGIGEYAVSTAAGAVLSAHGLGSCVGLALVDREAGLAGLAHLFVPQADVGRGPSPKFADAGTTLLVEELEARGGTRESLEAKLAGGSYVLDVPVTDVGAQNVAAVRATLADHDVPIVAADVGGQHSRSLRLEPDTGTLVVESATGESRRI